MPEGLVARYLAPFVGRDGVEQLHTIVRSIRAQDLHEEELRTIGAPTLIVAGERDRGSIAGRPSISPGSIPEPGSRAFPVSGDSFRRRRPTSSAELILRFDEGR